MDLAVSVFRLTNARGYQVPRVEASYFETDTGRRWSITAGGTRVYLVRFADELDLESEDQAVDSHFMMRRLLSALMIAGVGLFQSELMGRFMLKHATGKELSWMTTLNMETGPDEQAPEDDHVMERIGSWFQALSDHNVLRRAADEAHLALSLPHEAGIFVYRGFEWFRKIEKRSWDQIAEDVGASHSEMDRFKRSANDTNIAVRHASGSGNKLRTTVENYGTWVAALFDAIESGRARLESGYERRDSKEIAGAVMRAITMAPYK